MKDLDILVSPSVLERAGEHRLQILYTQIDRDAANRPAFRSFSFGLTDEYFYRASTVKLPAGVLALEKLRDISVPGLTRDTPLRIEAATASQTAVDRDPSKADGLPTIAHYVKKVFLVSDNDAFNRLYEFLGQREINERLWSRGFTDARILRRLEAALDPEENRLTNPFVFLQEIANDLADLYISQFGQQRGKIAPVIRAPKKRQQLWEEQNVIPRGIDREVVEALHRTHIGDDQDPVHILQHAIRTGLADGWGGSMIATDVADILFGTPAPLLGQANLGVLKDDMVNIVVQWS